ncbi:MAG: ribonuclease D [Hyphomonadaceae bacterium]|nr:MAG: ribonuclease D [Hyphomonadaceae bacterium]
MANYPSLNSVKSVLAFGMNLITTNKALLETCLALKNQPFIAVDTEFMRETTYWPKLCLIQVAAEGVEAIIDPLVEGLDLSPLLEIMRDVEILKLFHAPRI